MFAILLYCKRFTAINYSLNLTFFYKFSAILLGWALFFETGDLFGMDPDPNPTRTLAPTGPSPIPNTEQLFAFHQAAGTANVNLVSRGYWL